jgi:hypothetical protein
VSTLDGIREGIAANLRTITGLRAVADLPDNPNPPIALVAPRTIEYDQAFAKGLAVYTFTVSVIVGRVAEREAQRRLNAYSDNKGSSSVKTAIESDKTLGGKAFDVRVISMDNIGAIQLNDATYLGADFTVSVYSN